MVDNVVTMPGVAPPLAHTPIQDDVIARLESLLDNARSGLVVSLAYVAISRDGLIRSDWIGPSSREMLGYGLSKLTAQYYRACMDDE